MTLEESNIEEKTQKQAWKQEEHMSPGTSTSAGGSENLVSYLYIYPK